MVGLQKRLLLTADTDVVIYLAILSPLDYLDNKTTYVGMLFIADSSAFNIIPNTLIPKVLDLGIGITT